MTIDLYYQTEYTLGQLEVEKEVYEEIIKVTDEKKALELLKRELKAINKAIKKIKCQ